METSITDKIAWQIGSKSPPKVCLCCAIPFDANKHKIMGPYYEAPYIWVCLECWLKPFLWFPDKLEITGNQFGFQTHLYRSDTIEITKVKKKIQKSSIQPQNEPTKYIINVTSERPIHAELKMLPLADLRLDPRNVRFKHIPSSMTDEEIQDKIWNEPDTKYLFKEVKYSQGLTETPVVKPLADGKYVVVEGNRRVVVLRRIASEIRTQKERDMPIEKIDPQQCIVLPADVREEDVALYLARVHVSGKKEWATLNQAAHIHELTEHLHFTERDIAEAISISTKTVSQMKKAYSTVLRYHEKYTEEPDWLYKFSYFFELFKKPKLKEWLEDPKNTETFMKWIHNGQVERAEQVRKLEKIIVDCKDGYSAMVKGAKVTEAYSTMLQTKQKQPSITDIVDQVDDEIVGLNELVRNFPKSKIDEYAKEHEKLLQLESLHKELGSLIKHIKAMAAT